MKILKIILLSLFCLTLGIAGGFYMAEEKGLLISQKTSAPAQKEKREKKILFYRSPMNPSVTSPVPKKDEMGMDYVPVYEGGGKSSEPSGTVRIDPVVEQNIGVRTGTAAVRDLSRIIRTYGRVSYDEDTIYSIYPRFQGWLDRVYVSKAGDNVTEGQVLATIYSPDLVATQQEYLLAVKGRKHLADADIDLIRRDSEALVKSARTRLKLFGVSQAEISRLERTGRSVTSLAMRSSITGTVLKVNAREGGFVTPSTELYRVSDLSRVYVLAEVYDTDFPWIKRDDETKVSFAAGPGRSIRGRVQFIYPYEDKRKRTVQVRMVFENRDGLLKPGMFVNCEIEASPRQVLAVPSEAIIRSGIRQIVFVKKGPGRYEPRRVESGVESGGFTEIISGLTAGEEVVTSAQFLIDSESKLREATLKMTSPAKTKDDMKMEMDQADDKGNN